MTSHSTRPDRSYAEYLGGAGPGPDCSWRTAQGIRKPKDWRAFRRGCVVLFQEDIKNPHALEAIALKDTI